MTIDTHSLNTATAIMAILHDAVINPEPGGLVQVKAKIQVAVREAIQGHNAGRPALDPDAEHLHTVAAAQRQHLAGIAQALDYPNKSPEELVAEVNFLVERHNKLLAEHNRLAFENVSQRNELADLQHVVSSLRQEVSRHLRRLNDVSADRDAMRDKNEELAGELEAAKKTIAPYDVHNGELLDDLNAARAQSAKYAEQLDAAQETLKSIRRALSEDHEQLGILLPVAVCKIVGDLAEITKERNDLLNQNTELSRILQRAQEALGIGVTEDAKSPIAEDCVILDAIAYAKGRLTADHQRALRNIGAQWMPAAGQAVLNAWILNQPREA